MSTPSAAQQTQFFLSARLGEIERLKELSTVVDPNRENDYGQTPLMLATIYNRLETVKYLVCESKADINRRNPITNKTALDVAFVHRSRSEYAPLIEWLIANGATVGPTAETVSNWEDEHKHVIAAVSEPAVSESAVSEPVSVAAADVATAEPVAESPVVWDSAYRNVLLFPGQGAQSVGMLRSHMTEARPLLARASKICGLDLESIVSIGPKETLDRTDISQLVLLIASVVAYEVFKRENPTIVVDTAAGFSLGEYSALVCAGAINVDDGLRLLWARGQAMLAASKQTRSGMMTIIGLTDSELQTEIDGALKDSVGGSPNGHHEVLVVANKIFPKARVVAGTEKSLSRLEERIGRLNRIVPAPRCTRLSVSGAFHSPVMASAQSMLDRELAVTEISMPRIRVMSNVNAKPYDSVAMIRRQLSLQLQSAVEWEQTMETICAVRDGKTVEAIWELGCGNQLKSMLGRISKDGHRVCKNISV
jgi:[acyl-carrier-protein] S-malonyltransferase